MQFTGRRAVTQRRVWTRRPEEITQPAGQLPVRHRLRCAPRSRVFDAVQEGRRDKHPGQHQMKRLVVREFFAAQLAIQPAQFVGFFGREGTAIGLRRKFDQALDLDRLAGQQTFAEGRHAVGDRLAIRFEQLRVAVLRGVLH